ncbi:MAG TPA: TetR family transcriptional regulator [Nocardioides sp.]|nr:TetR family transcriptional regulator [Nocardioides sp.]
MADVELLSPHGIALLQLAHDPRSRVQDIAERVGLSERAAQRLISDLIDAGLVVRAGSGPAAAFDVPEAVRARVVPLQGLSRGDEAGNGGGATKRDDIRGRLLAAVERIIEAGGSYAEITVERLVVEAEISRSTFYAYFQDKAGLLQALVGQVLDEMWAAAEAWISLPPQADRLAVRAAMVGVVEAYRRHRVVMIAAADGAASTPSMRSQYEALMSLTVARIAEHVRSGQRAGYVRPDIDAAHAATLLTWGTERGLYKLVGSSGSDDVARAGRALADLVWNLLYAGYR